MKRHKFIDRPRPLSSPTKSGDFRNGVGANRSTDLSSVWGLIWFFSNLKKSAVNARQFFRFLSVHAQLM